MSFSCFCWTVCTPTIAQIRRNSRMRGGVSVWLIKCLVGNPKVRLRALGVEKWIARLRWCLILGCKSVGSPRLWLILTGRVEVLKAVLQVRRQVLDQVMLEKLLVYRRLKGVSISIGFTIYSNIRYTAAEHLDRTQYTCSNCSTSTGATKQMSIKILPNVLCLQLKVLNPPILLTVAIWRPTSKSGRTCSLPSNIGHDSIHIPHNFQYPR